MCLGHIVCASLCAMYFTCISHLIFLSISAWFSHCPHFADETDWSPELTSYVPFTIIIHIFQNVVLHTTVISGKEFWLYMRKYFIFQYYVLFSYVVLGAEVLCVPQSLYVEVLISRNSECSFTWK